ncbi:helix-turn-helix transcriptional regulator [Aliivibrio fischeri]|uniref:helix-turn-helix transcriptional regulator n=1 Tax=Aliivibrio fischeri TaxID=668 RepID=UPI00084C7B74|nr:hypothetical protein [Aliivibrio fischeri]OED51069.1 hypothetical protein BEI47_10520 [Aliivibrio fischeri]
MATAISSTDKKGVAMSLIDTKEVCELLQIPSTALFALCKFNISDVHLNFDIPNTTKIDCNSKVIDMGNKIYRAIDNKKIIPDFPKPLEIGRKLKWKREDINNWIESLRTEHNNNINFWNSL